MTGKKRYSPKMLYSVNLEDLVPEDDFYRRLETILDLRFLYKEVKGLYGKTGKPSIDPVVFIKLLLYGYFEGIISDRQLIRRASDSLSARYYLGYDIDEELPWHSTISRTRKLYPAEIFEKVFTEVLEQCVQAGLVNGEHQSIDSTLVKANASMESLTKRATITELQAYLEKTKAENDLEGKGSKKHQDKEEPPQNKSTKTTSNKDYVSKTDGDSKIKKKGKSPTGLYYQTHYSVDSKKNVITDVYTSKADKPDMVYVPKLIRRLIKRSTEHGFTMRSISADKGYFSGENLRIIELEGLIPYIPREKSHGKEGYYDQKEFRYDEDKDKYICPAGKELKRFCNKKTHKSIGYKAKQEDCSGCLLKPQCTDTRSRIIYRSYYIEEYKRLSERLKTEEYKIAMKYRKTGPERLFAEAKENHGLRKYMSRGIKSAQKNSFIIATVQNIKRLLKAQKDKLREPNIILSLQNHFLSRYELVFSID